MYAATCTPRAYNRMQADAGSPPHRKKHRHRYRSPVAQAYPSRFVRTPDRSPAHSVTRAPPPQRRGMQCATCMIFSTLGPQYASTCRHSTMLRLRRGSLTRSGRRSTEVISAMQASVRQGWKTIGFLVENNGLVELRGGTCLRSSNAAILFAAECTAGCRRRGRFRQGCRRLNTAWPIADA